MKALHTQGEPKIGLWSLHLNISFTSPWLNQLGWCYPNRISRSFRIKGNTFTNIFNSTGSNLRIINLLKSQLSLLHCVFIKFCGDVYSWQKFLSTRMFGLDNSIFGISCLLIAIMLPVNFWQGIVMFWTVEIVFIVCWSLAHTDHALIWSYLSLWVKSIYISQTQQ